MANLLASCIELVSDRLFLGGLITGVSILVVPQIVLKLCKQTVPSDVNVTSKSSQRKPSQSEEESSGNEEDWDDVLDDDDSDEDDVPVGEEIKLMLIVRTDLGMGKGKAAAQCAHAAVAAYRQASVKAKNLLQVWFRYGQPKVVVKVNSEEELLSIAANAKQRGLINCVISDAGRTQIQSGSKTVLALGPASNSQLGPLTGHLKLY